MLENLLKLSVNYLFVYSYVLLQVCLRYRRPGWVWDPEYHGEVWPAHKRLIYKAIIYYCRYAFAIGGQDGSEILSIMERYDPHTNAWYIKLSYITAGMPSLSEARMGLRSWVSWRGMTRTPMPDIYSYHVLPTGMPSLPEARMGRRSWVSWRCMTRTPTPDI